MDFTFHNGTNGSAPWVEFYPYTPSLTAGYAFMAIFGIATIFHIILIFPYRATYFIPFVLGGICETFGYYGRALSHASRTAIGPWAQQLLLLLCAPPLLAATIYMLLARLIRALDGEHLSPLRTSRMTKIFVLNDVICLLTQLVGAGVQVTGDERVMAIGQKAVLAGLVLGLVVFGGFILVAGVFHRRLSSREEGIISGGERGGVEGGKVERGWKGYMWALYVVCAAMMVRNLVRTVEFGAGKGAAVRTQEVYIYVFDAGMMMFTMGVLVIWHPGRLIRRVTKQKGIQGGDEGGMHLLEDK